MEIAAPLALRDRVAHLLDTPAWSPWIEKRLPRGVPAATQDAAYIAPRNDVELPQGYWPIRIETNGNNLWVLGASQNLDPTGEVSPGGYWLLHSTNEGRDWEPPLYAGLRALQPYVVSSSSKLAMVNGDRVTLEVQVRELDPRAIQLPPLRLAFRREKSGLFLEASLVNLRRDSDGDGLTDLVEARLLTDPQDPDTDKDGIGDGQDSFPTVPRGGSGPSAAAEITTSALAEIRRDRHTANVVGTVKSLLQAAMGRPAPLPPDSAVYLIGDRAGLAGVQVSSRVIVLTREEAQRVSEERGLLFPVDLQIVVDETAQHAQLTWSEGWRGGWFDAHKEKGRWILVSLGTWIS